MFKTIFSITCLFLAFNLYAQNETEAIFWGENDLYKNATEIPEELKNQSAVVIYKNENYDFHKFG